MGRRCGVRGNWSRLRQETEVPPPDTVQQADGESLQDDAFSCHLELSTTHSD